MAEPHCISRINIPASMMRKVKNVVPDLPYNVVRLKSWDEYLAIISDSPYQNWAFRGQRDASAPLFSVISRYFLAFGERSTEAKCILRTVSMTR